MTVRVAVARGDASASGEVRRSAAGLAAAVRLGETEASRLAILATEAATNLARHTGDGGAVLLRPCARGGVAGVELLAVDAGPGMADPEACLRDGYSTAGSQGTGLGALRRQADDFDLFSEPGRGTVVLARVWAARPPAGPLPSFAAGAVNLPKPGQEVSGDAWAVVEAPGRAVCMVADGLGHGPDAAAASREAVRVFTAHALEGPVPAVERMHEAMRHTRGAAVGVADVSAAAGVVRFAGIGNVMASVVSPLRSQSMVSHNGIVGHQVRKVQAFEHPWTRAAVLVMASDGVGTRWDLGRYPGLAGHDPAVLAAVLHRDYVRGTDDATVLTLREVV